MVTLPPLEKRPLSRQRHLAPAASKATARSPTPWRASPAFTVAVVAAVANGLCEKGRDITVRVRGGDLVVNYTDEKVTLTGDARLVYTGEVEY